ncbi:MAG: cytochrome c biogenesis protein [Proteobacteria bacterium]|nr:cytochrome c biogenesis protein [Pseudomonadota bacterium]MBU4297460.1 cytochrome c biogenesis protein [Pseudomonadota bacterium]MCG2746443.1 cytochrome c biogenesis protein [Desulfobulbaceae bacterium]
MEHLLPLAFYSRTGHGLLLVLLVFAGLTGLSGTVNLCRPTPLLARATSFLLGVVVLLFVTGFLGICWFHYQIFQRIALELPPPFAEMLNQQLTAMNQGAEYGLPLYRAEAPPRYMLPLWLENEKYYFWFMCYAVMALIGHLRLKKHRFRAALHVLLAIQVCILFFQADPFLAPLPKFFGEVAPWFTTNMADGQRFGFFMRLYPRMIFYYNAQYMWFHPPLLFLSYACITMTFAASSFMLVRHDLDIEILGYDFAKLGYFLLTLGMLLGYPWALKAWGPNWWWDPKICSSIMMWAIYSTYLHTRLYANKPAMWYFTSLLGVVCFLAMIFTFLSSFFFPGEHTFVG